MRIGIISGVLGLTVVLPAHAQKSDSIKSLLLPDVVVTESYQQRQAKKSALAVDVVDQDFLRKHFTGNFMQAMENIPGVQAMDIGSGFSKPMIRGMGFNRIAVLANGIKQEGLTFTNIGDAPLVIHQAVASCGCTVPEYTKEPIMPGKKGTIKVTYNGTGKYPGHFKKSITLRTNAKTEMVRLYIEGDMTAKDAK